VLIFVWVSSKVVLHLVSEYLWKPRVITKVDLENLGILWRLWPTQQEINRIGLLARIP
jgi:hypothetical protein